MSDAREEAAIARDALVRDKKKPKQQTTLLTKWNIVLDYGESGLGMNEYCAEYNDRERRTSQIHYTCMNYWMQMG